MKRPSERSRRRKHPDIRIGTSGWSYAHWRRVFYPEDLPSTKWFGYYSRYFDSVELNNSFYNLPTESTFLKWRRDAPPEFVFAVKANRFITHMKKLKDVNDVLSVFLERAAALGRSLGPILFQLPPNLHFDHDRLRDFLKILPPRRRYAVEFRHPSWLDHRAIDLLARRKIAFCIHDLLEEPCPDHVTAAFAYFRFHGHNEKYGGSYPKKVLTGYAETMADMLSRGKDVYAYFNNDAYGYALKDAVRLRKILSKIVAG
jgi:uncharacterized protein YecE (DUF72 family)